MQGKGTFVARPKVAQMLELSSYTEGMRAQGLNPQTVVLDTSYIGADDELAVLLGIRAGSRVLRIHRLRLADGQPMSVDTSHLSAQRFPGLRRNLDRHPSLYEALATDYGVEIAEAQETIETVLADPQGRAAAAGGCRHAAAAAVPARLRRLRDPGGVGAVPVPWRPLQVRDQAPAMIAIAIPGLGATGAAGHERPFLPNGPWCTPARSDNSYRLVASPHERVSGHGGGQAVAAARRHGVTTLFTLSGGHVFPLYDGAVRMDPPMRLVDVRHEQTAVFAAEATARLTRRPGWRY